MEAFWKRLLRTMGTSTIRYPTYLGLELYMNFFLLVAKWGWIFLVGLNLLNYFTTRNRLQELVPDDPERQKRYKKILRIFCIDRSIPFIVMGIGIVIGGVPTIFHFFFPPDGDPFVWAFLSSFFILWAFNFYWVFFRGGAQMLAEHPLTTSNNPLLIKLRLLSSLAVGVFCVYMIFQRDLPVDLLFDF